MDEGEESETTDRLESRNIWGKNCPNVPHGRLAEETAVFAIELRSAFVADLKSRAGGIKTIVQHQAPGRLEPELFLILKRTHCSQHPEMMM